MALRRNRQFLDSRVKDRGEPRNFRDAHPIPLNGKSTPLRKRIFFYPMHALVGRLPNGAHRPALGRHRASASRLWWWRIPLVLLAIGCQSHRAAPVTAEREGILDSPLPPRIHAARQVDTALASRGTGGLVVVVAPRSRTGSSVHVQLFPNDVFRDSVREDSTGAAHADGCRRGLGGRGTGSEGERQG